MLPDSTPKMNNMKEKYRAQLTLKRKSIGPVVIPLKEDKITWFMKGKLAWFKLVSILLLQYMLACLRSRKPKFTHFTQIHCNVLFSDYVLFQ